MTIGNRISELRKEKGYTQEYIAEQLGVSRQAVSKWESGNSVPSTENLLHLADILGVPLSKITQTDDEETNLSALEEYACQKLREERIYEIKRKKISRLCVQIGLLIIYYLVIYYCCWFFDYCLGRRVYIFTWMCQTSVLQITLFACVGLILLKHPLASIGLCIGTAVGIVLGHLVGWHASVYSPVPINNGWVFYLASVYLVCIIGLVYDYKVSENISLNKPIRITLSILVAIILVVSSFRAAFHMRRVYGANLGYRDGYAAGAYDAQQGYTMNETHNGTTPEPDNIQYYDFAYYGYKMYWYSGYVDGFNNN